MRKNDMKPRRQEVRHRCDWMNDEELRGYIESCTGLLHEALEEQKERRERVQAEQKQRANMDAMADGGWPPHPSEY